MEDYRLLEPVFDKSETLKALVYLYGIDHALIVDAVAEFLVLRTNALNLNGGLKSWVLRSLNADCQRCILLRACSCDRFASYLASHRSTVQRTESQRIASSHLTAPHHGLYRIASRDASDRIAHHCSPIVTAPPRAHACARHQYSLTQGTCGGSKADAARRLFSASTR